MSFESAHFKNQKHDAILSCICDGCFERCLAPISDAVCLYRTHGMAILSVKAGAYKLAAYVQAQLCI